MSNYMTAIEVHRRVEKTTTAIARQQKNIHHSHVLSSVLFAREIICLYKKIKTTSLNIANPRAFDVI